MFTRGRGHPASGRRLHPLKQQRLWGSGGTGSKLPYRIPDLPGGVAVNPRNPSQPGLVHYVPPGVHGRGGIVRNPRRRPANDPISNLARAALVGIPLSMLAQLGTSPAHVIRDIARGRVPGREDIGNTLSMLPFGPRGEFGSRIESMPGERAGQMQMGWQVRRPRAHEKVLNWQGEPQHWEPLTNIDHPGYTGGETRNVYHHGEYRGTAFGFYERPGGGIAFSPKEAKQFDFSSLYVPPAYRKTPAALHLMRDMVDRVAKQGLAPHDIHALFANSKLQAAVNKWMQRIGPPPSKYKHIDYPTQDAMALEAALQIAGRRAFGQRTEPLRAAPRGSDPLLDRYSLTPPPYGHDVVQVTEHTLNALGDQGRATLATKMDAMGEDAVASLLRAWHFSDPGSRERIAEWVRHALGNYQQRHFRP